MTNFVETIITVTTSILTTSGFWVLLNNKILKQSATSKLLIGIGHDRITYLALLYLNRGMITHDEYENLNNYLYEPYVAAGGNGSAKRLMDEVKKLPIR